MKSNESNMEVDREKGKKPVRERIFYDCEKLYAEPFERYMKLQPDQKNAYWFLKLTAANLAKWTDINVFESGQSALEAVVHATSNIRIDENKSVSYNTRKFSTKPESEPTKEAIKKIKKGTETASMEFWRSCKIFYGDWKDVPEYVDVKFPYKEMGGNEDGTVKHMYVCLRDLAETILKQVENVEMFAINPKKKGDTIELKYIEEKANALVLSLGKLAVESVSVKDLVYTAKVKQGNSRTRDVAWHLMNAKGSHLPESMKMKHVKSTSYQAHYKKCTSLFGKLKNAKRDEKEKLMIVANRSKNNLKQMVSSQAQKCIIDNLFTGSGFADRDGLVDMLNASLYFVKPKRNTNYKIPVVCLNLVTGMELPRTYIDHVIYYSNAVARIKTAYDWFVPTLCMLDMLSDSCKTMTTMFGKIVPDRDSWKRPKLGFSQTEIQVMDSPINPLKVYAPMKGSPSFVANEEKSEVYFPAMGGCKRKYDRITSGIDGGSSQMIKAFLSAEIEVNKTLDFEGNVSEVWSQKGGVWTKEESKDEEIVELMAKGKEAFISMMEGDKKKRTY